VHYQKNYIDSLKANRAEVPFTATDFIDGLSNMDPVYRRAVLFGLEQQLDASEVIDMTWRLALQLPLTELARKCVASAPRHIRLPYLFWTEDDSGMQTPLLQLHERVLDGFYGRSWSELQHAYQAMVWIDFKSEEERFIQQMRDEGLLPH
jgi:hypothetical protein